jgi:hypothetical protein
MIFDVTAGNSDGGVSRLLPARECVWPLQATTLNVTSFLPSFLPS